jgi:hypothetical protein
MVLDPAIGQQMNSIFVDDLHYAEEISAASSANARGLSVWRSGAQTY